jgi:hypothetical protein
MIQHDRLFDYGIEHEDPDYLTRTAEAICRTYEPNEWARPKGNTVRFPGSFSRTPQRILDRHTDLRFLRACKESSVKDLMAALDKTEDTIHRYLRRNKDKLTVTYKRRGKRGPLTKCYTSESGRKTTLIPYTQDSSNREPVGRWLGNGVWWPEQVGSCCLRLKSYEVLKSMSDRGIRPRWGTEQLLIHCRTEKHRRTLEAERDQDVADRAQAEKHRKDINKLVKQLTFDALAKGWNPFPDDDAAYAGLIATYASNAVDCHGASDGVPSSTAYSARLPIAVDGTHH